MDHQFPPPINDKDFERFCLDFLRTYWLGSNPQKWGRSGQQQFGVDVIDMNAVKPLRGGQAKFRKMGSLLTPDELEHEVVEARKFDLNGLKLGRYTVLTTCENDTALQGRVVNLNYMHREQGLFEIELLTWEMIEEVLREHPRLWERAIGKSLKALVEPIASGISEIQRGIAGVKVQFEEITTHSSFSSVDTRLNAAKLHLDSHRQQEAELMLSSLRVNQWPEMTPYQRFRTLSLLGRVALDHGEPENAGRLFIEGAQHFPDDERAKTNQAVGLELMGDTLLAHSLACSLLAHYPHSVRIWAVRCRTTPEAITASDIEAEMPPSVRNDDEVLVALALRAWGHSDWTAVARYSEAATRGDADWAVPWTQLGQAKLQLALRSAYIPVTNRVFFRDHKEFEDAILCFDRAVGTAERTHCRVHLIQALVYRAKARALDGDIDGAKRDFAEATRYAPNDRVILEQYGRHLLGYDGASDAVPILRRAVSVGAQGDAKRALAVALCNLDEVRNRHEYTELACDAARDKDSSFRFQALDLALRGMVKAHRFDDAESFLDSLERLGIPPAAIEAGKARIEFGRGETDAAQRRSLNTVTTLSEDNGEECRRFVAETLDLTGNFPAALVELATLAKQSRLLPDAWSLVEVAKRLGRHDVIRDLCREWRDAGVKDPRLVYEELVVLERYEPQRAVAVIEQLLDEAPNDTYFTLRLSLLGIRLGRANLVCSDPTRLPAFDETHPKNGVAIVRTLIHGGNPDAAVEFAYRLLRHHPRNPEANANFAWAMLLSEHSLPPAAFQTPETVQPGAAFSYTEFSSANEKWLVIEDDPGETV